MKNLKLNWISPKLKATDVSGGGGGMVYSRYSLSRKTRYWLFMAVTL
jgi:hypothetical protein